MMLTGWQIREARRLLHWRREGLVPRAGVPFSVVDRAEASDGEVRITVDQEAAIRRVFVAVEIEFGVGDDGSPTVRLRRGAAAMLPTGRQIREGRALAGMTQAELAAAADVALGLVIRAEDRDGMPMLRIRDAKSISAALIAAGVEFMAEGVRLREDPA